MDTDVPSYIPAISADGQLAPGLAASIVRDVLGLGSQQNHEMAEAHLYDPQEAAYGGISLFGGEYFLRQHEGDLAPINVSRFVSSEGLLGSLQVSSNINAGGSIVIGSDQRLSRQSGFGGLVFGGDNHVYFGNAGTSRLDSSGNVDANAFRQTGNTTQALVPSAGIWYLDCTSGIRMRDPGSAYASRFQIDGSGNATFSGTGEFAGNVRVALGIHSGPFANDIRMQANSTGFAIGSDGVIATAPNAGYAALGDLFNVADARIRRGTTSQWRIEANNGLAVQNLANNAAAPISCSSVLINSAGRVRSSRVVFNYLELDANPTNTANVAANTLQGASSAGTIANLLNDASAHATGARALVVRQNAIDLVSVTGTGTTITGDIVGQSNGTTAYYITPSLSSGFGVYTLWINRPTGGNQVADSITASSGGLSRVSNIGNSCNWETILGGNSAFTVWNGANHLINAYINGSTIRRIGLVRASVPNVAVAIQSPNSGDSILRLYNSSASTVLNVGDSDGVTITAGTYTGTTVQQLAFGPTDNASRGYIGFRGQSWNQLGLWGPGQAVTSNPALAVSGSSVFLAGVFQHMGHQFRFNNRNDLTTTPGFEVSGGGGSMPVARFTGYSGQTADYIQCHTSGGTKEFSVAPGGNVTTSGYVDVAGSVLISGGIIRAAYNTSVNLGSGFTTSNDNFANLFLRSNARIGFGNQLGLASPAADVLEINNGTPGTLRDLSCRTITGSSNFIHQPRSVVSLTNNGQLEVEATSNTQLTFRFRGSDGVTRSASLTLS